MTNAEPDRIRQVAGLSDMTEQSNEDGDQIQNNQGRYMTPRYQRKAQPDRLLRPAIVPSQRAAHPDMVIK